MENRSAFGRLNRYELFVCENEFYASGTTRKVATFATKIITKRSISFWLKRYFIIEGPSQVVPNLVDEGYCSYPLDLNIGGGYEIFYVQKPNAMVLLF